MNKQTPGKPRIKKGDLFYMQEALKEAQKALSHDEVPVGAVIVASGSIIARSHNLTELLTDSTAHAEMLALTSAQNHLASKYLDECTLYVTLEPCSMCAGALFWCQIGALVYGASDPTHGFTSSGPTALHPSTKTRRGILEQESSTLLKSFFKTKR